MDNSNRLNLLTLVAMLERVVDEYKSRGIHEIDLGDRDGYWVSATEGMLDPYNMPDDALGLGSVEDDLGELQKLFADEDHMASAVDLERIGNLLRVASQVLVED